MRKHTSVLMVPIMLTTNICCIVLIFSVKSVCKEKLRFFWFQWQSVLFLNFTVLEWYLFVILDNYMNVTDLHITGDGYNDDPFLFKICLVGWPCCHLSPETTHWHTLLLYRLIRIMEKCLCFVTRTNSIPSRGLQRLLCWIFCFVDVVFKHFWSKIQCLEM